MIKNKQISKKEVTGKNIELNAIKKKPIKKTISESESEEDNLPSKKTIQNKNISESESEEDNLPSKKIMKKKQIKKTLSDSESEEDNLPSKKIMKKTQIMKKKSINDSSESDPEISIKSSKEYAVKKITENIYSEESSPIKKPINKVPKDEDSDSTISKELSKPLNDTDDIVEENQLYFNIDKFNEENIVFSKPLYFYKVSKFINIYYKNPEKKTNIQPKRKIIVKTPKMLIPFLPKETEKNGHKSYNMSLSFSTMTNMYNEDQIIKFFKFIKKIDRINRDTVMEYANEWGLPEDISYRDTLQRTSDKYPYHMNISMPYDKDHGFLFNMYDENAKKMDWTDIHQRNIVSTVLELTSIWFKENKFGTNWTLIQLRRSKPYSPIQDSHIHIAFGKD